MKTKNGFRLRQLGDEYILIGESVELINFNNLITLNESAAYLWRSVDGQGDFDAEKLTQLLLSEYEVEEDVARRDATATLQSWQEAGLLE